MTICKNQTGLNKGSGRITDMDGGEKQVTSEWVIISDTIDKDNYILALTYILKHIEKTSICQ